MFFFLINKYLEIDLFKLEKSDIKPNDNTKEKTI